MQQQCLREGVILELGGRHGAVVRFLPPLTISAEEIDVLVEKFQHCLSSVVASTH
ncbi:diaminobutyrate--2-oxoglutarate aminotransferase [compost metagenome]